MPASRLEVWRRCRHPSADGRSTPLSRRCALALAAVALLIAAGLAGADVRPARAAVIMVTTTSGGTGGPDCTLRDAIVAANLDAAVGGCAAGSGGDTVALAPGAAYTFAVPDNTVG